VLLLASHAQRSLRRRMATVVALCDCPADITGRVFSSLDLIDEWGLNVRGLDGVARV
jgi:citronellol/citronellal dehydrogenase